MGLLKKNKKKVAFSFIFRYVDDPFTFTTIEMISISNSERSIYM
jgi:hypothetical protein